MLHVRQHSQQRVRTRTTHYPAYGCETGLQLFLFTGLAAKGQVQLQFGVDVLIACRDHQKVTLGLCASTQDCQTGQYSSRKLLPAQGTQIDLSPCNVLRFLPRVTCPNHMHEHIDCVQASARQRDCYRHGFSDMVQMILAGQTPEVVMNSALTAVKFYMQQQNVRAQPLVSSDHYFQVGRAA